jgi:cytochrome c556
MKRLLVRCLLAAGVSTLALPAAAQFQKPEDAVKYRQGAFTVMASHFGRLGAMANGRVPFDAATAQANADLVVTLSRLPYVAFTPGRNQDRQPGPDQGRVRCRRPELQGLPRQFPERVSKRIATQKSPLTRAFS